MNRPQQAGDKPGNKQPRRSASANILPLICSEQNIDQAYQWLCQRRINYSANSDIWALRAHWSEQRQIIMHDLRLGRYHFSALSLYPIKGEVYSIWCAGDALVLRAIAQVLGPILDIHPACLHVKGNGGVSAGLVWADTQRKAHSYFYRSDVKGYYRHIRHGVLLRQLQQRIRNRRLMAILRRYLARNEYCRGVYSAKHQGLNKGDPLAPLMAALYLKPLDRALSKLGEYRRFMDDWLIFTQDRLQLRRAIKTTQRILKKLGMTTHPNKTFSGSTQRRFHFLGLEFTARQIRLPLQRLLTIKTKVAAIRISKVGLPQDYIKRVERWIKAVISDFLDTAEIGPIQEQLQQCLDEGTLHY